MVETRPAIRFDYASVKAFIPVDAKPAVYRIYEADVLVYVGSSARLRQRLFTQLNRGFPGDTVELEFFRNTTAMLRGERAALDECPVFNETLPARHPSWHARKV